MIFLQRVRRAGHSFIFSEAGDRLFSPLEDMLSTPKKLFQVSLTGLQRFRLAVLFLIPINVFNMIADQTLRLSDKRVYPSRQPAVMVEKSIQNITWSLLFLDHDGSPQQSPPKETITIRSMPLL